MEVKFINWKIQVQLLHKFQKISNSSDFLTTFILIPTQISAFDKKRSSLGLQLKIRPLIIYFIALYSIV